MSCNLNFWVDQVENQQESVPMAGRVVKESLNAQQEVFRCAEVGHKLGTVVYLGKIALVCFTRKLRPKSTGENSRCDTGSR